MEVDEPNEIQIAALVGLWEHENTLLISGGAFLSDNDMIAATGDTNVEEITQIQTAIIFDDERDDERLLRAIENTS